PARGPRSRGSSTRRCRAAAPDAWESPPGEVQPASPATTRTARPPAAPPHAVGPGRSPGTPRPPPPAPGGATWASRGGPRGPRRRCAGRARCTWPRRATAVPASARRGRCRSPGRRSRRTGHAGAPARAAPQPVRPGCAASAGSQQAPVLAQGGGAQVDLIGHPRPRGGVPLVGVGPHLSDPALGLEVVQDLLPGVRDGLAHGVVAGAVYPVRPARYVLSVGVAHSL